MKVFILYVYNALIFKRFNKTNINLCHFVPNQKYQCHSEKPTLFMMYKFAFIPINDSFTKKVLKKNFVFIHLWWMNRLFQRSVSKNGFLVEALKEHIKTPRFRERELHFLINMHNFKNFIIIMNFWKFWMGHTETKICSILKGKDWNSTFHGMKQIAFHC